MNMSFDRFDQAILQALQKDARLTNGDLGELVGLSPSQCSRRRMQLEKSGVIDGYHARLNFRKSGLGLTSLVSISLLNHDEDNAADLRRLLRNMPNVLYAYALTGEMDYLVTVVTADLDELSEIINKTLLPHMAVQNVRTSIALETIKDSCQIPVR